MKRAALMVAVATTFTACAPAIGTEEPVLPDAMRAAQGDITILVENERPVHMKVFATRANMRFLVGELPPFQRGSFRLPPMILNGRGEFRLLAEHDGSTVFQESDPIVLSDGRQVRWRLRRGGGAQHWVQ